MRFQFARAGLAVAGVVVSVLGTAWQVDGQELKNLGPGGRDLKNRAMEWIDESKTNAPNLQLQAELEAERAKNQVLQDDLESLKTRDDR